jgi:hypothetical protein
MQGVSDYIRRRFHVYDREPTTEANWVEAALFCRKQLDPLVQAWIRLNAVIDDCMGDGTAERPGIGFKRLITPPKRHEADMSRKQWEAMEQKWQARQRWKALEREGYLFARLPHRGPAVEDPLARERYHIDIKFALATLTAPGDPDNEPLFGPA